MVGIGSGELQTLISTLQNLNTQVGYIFQALTSRPLPAAAMVVEVKIAGQMGATTPAAPLPSSPEGYVTLHVPGLGPRRVAFYALENGGGRP